MQRPGDGERDRPTPDALRDEVQGAIRTALARDDEHRGGRTGGRLALSGVLGVGGALAVTWLVAAHPLGHHPHWHEGFYSTLWAGLLIVALAAASLDIRIPRWPIAHAARAAVLALVLAGICAWACPDQHFLHWWRDTRAGGWIANETESLPLGAFCFGVVAAAVFALLAALPTLPRGRDRVRAWIVTSVFVALLQAPGIALQTTDTPPYVFAGWMGGSLIGSAAGVAAAGWARARRGPPSRDGDRGRVAP